VFTIERYKLTHFWALYEGGELVCVTVYKKGAIAVRDRLELLTGRRRNVKPERDLSAAASLLTV
jgi:hypothetical protein